jgi:hypothetical protein
MPPLREGGYDRLLEAVLPLDERPVNPIPSLAVEVTRHSGR